jgi:hypothetical protein
MAFSVGALLIAVQALAQEQPKGLLLKAGTFELGGQLALTIDHYDPDGFDSQTGYRVSLTPKFGYFVIDNLELNAEFTFATAFHDLYEDSPKWIEFGLGARYLFSIGGIHPYLGANFGMIFTLYPETEDTMDHTSKNMLLSFPIGVLIALNDHVALDFGIKIKCMIHIKDNDEDVGLTVLSIPIGFLGVQGFF